MRNLKRQLYGVLGAVALLASPAMSEASLIHYWDFDQTGESVATDLAGNLDATLSGNAQLATDAARGGVLSLAGGHASNPGVPFMSDMDHTTMLWAYHTDAGPLTQRYLSWGEVDGDTLPTRYYLGPDNESNDGRINAAIGNSGQMQFNDNNDDAKPLQRTWQHWTFVRKASDTNIAVLYLNGDKISSDYADHGGAISAESGLQIGRQITESAYFQGMLDDLAIFGEALSPWQIQNAMNHGPTQTNRSSLISHYRMDGNLVNAVNGELDGTTAGTGNLGYVPGAIGDGVQFGGKNYVSLTNDGRPNADAGLRTGSVAFWIKTTTGERSDVLGNANSASNTLLRVNLNAYDENAAAGRLYTIVRADSSDELRLSTAAADHSWRDGEWHHIVFAWDTTSFTENFGSIYIDGVPQEIYEGSINNIAVADEFSQWENPLFLGAGNNRGSSSWSVLPDGTALDDVGMWDGRLDDRRVAAMAGLGRFSGVDLASTDIDDILALQPNQATVAGSDLWWHTTDFAEPSGGGDLVAGRNYVGIDGFHYIILSGTPDNFTGVRTAPEPGSAALLACAFLCLLLWRRRK